MTEQTVTCTECGKSFTFPQGQTKGFCVFCGAAATLSAVPQAQAASKELLRETEPLKRLELLKALPDGPERTAALDLWHYRYTKGKPTETPNGDQFLGFLQSLMILSRNISSFFTAKQAQKELNRFLEAPALRRLAEAFPGRDVVYEELYHAARVYITCCKSDQRYNTTLLNMVKLNEDSTMAKIHNDLYGAAVLIPEKIGKAKQYEVLTKAAQDAYSDMVTPVRWVKA